MKNFILGAAISGSILFFFVSQTWLVVLGFWAIIAGLASIFGGNEDEDKIKW